MPDDLSNEVPTLTEGPAPEPWTAPRSAPARLLDTLKTLLWVAPLTILVWTYAEREQTIPMDHVTVPIAVRTDVANHLVQLVAPPDHNLMVDLVGPRAALDQVVSLLHTPDPKKPPVQITIGASYQPGAHHTITVNDLGDQPIFSDAGITVRNVWPPNIDVAVDELVDRTMPVQAPPDITVLTSAPVFAPTTVKVHGPASVLDKGPQYVYAELGTEDALKEPGHHEIADVPMAWPGDSQDVTITPLTVRASVDVRPADRTLIIPAVTVWPSAPAGFLDEYKLECPPRVYNVKVTGPPEKIDLLEKGEFQDIRARLEISNADLPVDVEHEKSLQFELPAGVSVVDANATPKVTFKLHRRAGTE